MTEPILITNNPLVRNKLEKSFNLEYCQVSYLELLKLVRDRIHLGYRLLTHPLSGSVKPSETPYKTVIISKCDSFHIDSLMIIENSISTARKLLKGGDIPNWNEKILEDFQVIDLSLIEGVIYKL